MGKRKTAVIRPFFFTAQFYKIALQAGNILARFRINLDPVARIDK